MQELVSLAKKEQERLSGTPTKSYYISEKIPQAPKDWKVMRMGKRLSKERKKYAKENSHKVEPMVVPHAK